MIDRSLLDRIQKFFTTQLDNLSVNHSKETMKKLNKYQSILSTIQDICVLYSEIEEINNLKQDDMLEIIKEETTKLTEQIKTLEDELISILITNESVGNNAIVEIRAGTGGDEASIFVVDLLNMYSNYANMQKWKIDIIEKSTNDIGIKSVTMIISGQGVFNRLQFEAGVHRVQRIPTTESNDRIHTSTATVAVMPEKDDTIVIDINKNDLQIDTYRASGAGGQHVNKTDSAVRITHKPTGLIVQCQDERSQHENKRRCMKELEVKLYKIEMEKQINERDSTRSEQIGTGSRGEKIRTYNFPQNRLTDHRWTGITIYQLNYIMDGYLDQLLDFIQTAYKTSQIQSLLQQY